MSAARSRRAAKLALACAAALWLVACGQKGPLRLPDGAGRAAPAGWHDAVAERRA